MFEKKGVELCGHRLRTILMQFEAKGVLYFSDYYKKVYMGFIGRVYKSCNTIVQTLENAWIIKLL